MVETLLSLVLLIAAVNLALRTSLGIHDHTIWSVFDGDRIYVESNFSDQFHLATAPSKCTGTRYATACFG